ncbi:hypothetical protein ACH4TI_15090 [Streptomyces rochei]|uniref:hypothetical protein n=1 Tax=Streptomyces rochei TaxID=1928 RepID=UPI00379AFBD7
MKVSEAFTPELIQSYVDSGEWTPQEGTAPKKTSASKATPTGEQPEGGGPAPVPDDGQAGEGGRPPVNAPKAEWIDYAVRQRALSREDAANFTKADLIEMFD